MEKSKTENKSNDPGQSPFSQTFFHGTRADLKTGNYIDIGLNSNHGQEKKAK